MHQAELRKVSAPLALLMWLAYSVWNTAKNRKCKADTILEEGLI
jgi:hypothetical protein